jgi:hypothetical protein
MIGFERASLALCLGDTWSVTGDAARLSGRTAALPVDDRRDTRTMMREIVCAIMRCRSVGRWRGWQPGSKASMMNKRPPQQGQGRVSGCAGSDSPSPRPQSPWL